MRTATVTTDIIGCLTAFCNMTKAKAFKTLQDAQMIGHSAGCPSKIYAGLVQQPVPYIRRNFDNGTGTPLGPDGGPVHQPNIANANPVQILLNKVLDKLLFLYFGRNISN